MSIELNWETLTGGPDGEALAERIRDFIHTKFQAVPLPRFIKSVKVHDFQFGSIPPRVVLKDICDPLADFYEEMPEADALDDSEDDDDDDDADDEYELEYAGGHAAGGRLGDDGVPDAIRAAEKRRRDEQRRRLAGGGGYGYGGGGGGSRSSSRSTSPPQTPDPGVSGFPPHIHTAGLRSAPATPDLSSPFRGLAVSAGTPGGVPGGTSNMHYFPSHIATGWSGNQTPLAAFAGGGGHLNLSGWLDSAAAGGRRNGGGSSPSSYYEPQSPSPHGDAGGGPGGYGYSNSNSNNNSYHHHHRGSSQSSVSVQDLSSASGSSSRTAPPQQTPQQSQGQGKLQLPLHEKHSVSTLAPTSIGTGGPSRPPTRDRAEGGGGGGDKDTERRKGEDDEDDGRGGRRRFREPRVEDMQAVFRIRYAGDVHLMLTAEILLDYPMPSFVGIPVKLNISGLSFDGVGVVAYIRHRIHFCFLSPEDAVAAVGADDDDDGFYDDDDDKGGREEEGDTEGAGEGQKQKQAGPKGRMGGLLQEIRVESEIGLREGSKQSLKNVGKVERFVLEQVRRIFEEEFVYPSFWTFLV